MDNVKHRALLVVAGLVGAVTLIASLSVAAAGTSRPATHASPAKSAAIVPPRVPNRAAIRAKYHGQSIQFIGDAAVGASHKRDLKLVARFQKDTGIKVNLVPHPSGSDAAYSQLARAFGSKSSKPDVAMIDVVWPGAFAPYLVNLKPALGKASKQFVQSIIQNDTIGGKLTPRGVTSYDEEGARNVFAAGNAMFMRNWPYAYSANQTTPVKGKFSVTVLPHGAAGHSVGTVGGWQLAVSKFSKHKPAAIEFVRYMTSPAVQKFNAIFNSNVPTIPAVAKIKAVVKTNPYLTPAIANVARV